MSARRPWALPLVPLYWAGLRSKDVLRAAGVLPVRRLQAPVLSIGSISSGGAGKTPTVMALAQLLTAQRWAVDVLSRGYGRSSSQVEQVEPAAANAAARFGDEPVLIAQRTGAPVWVGADRHAAGRAAESPHPADHAAIRRVHLLDDGFQHRRLARAMDLVLLTAEDLEDSLLPAGNRREPLSALCRADAILVREDEQEAVLERLRPLPGPSTPVWLLRRRLTLPETLRNGPQPVTAFCGIARPDDFFSMLRHAGLELAATVPFPDHHRYTAGDVRRVVQSCHLEGCTFVTTEKDAVKLEPELRAELERAGRLEVARLEVEFADPAAVLEAVEAQLA